MVNLPPADISDSADAPGSALALGSSICSPTAPTIG
ncbi:hypothetical protein MESS2_880013 [Mesorhizobium metallidurans STM 2683]|uniref:Uncharacterized protein n=1 Tax=Mesorhizobium metallidurans STM 2683 TaxID=1297569 RepID=M5EYQ6_9HYPH|nr:hypothetical protein MESS2_880013 [Mesorhizobium metallidurans STM 2683]